MAAHPSSGRDKETNPMVVTLLFHPKTLTKAGMMAL
jgi:hypothetical protein